MIASITGTITHAEGDRIIIQTAGGVGYAVTVTKHHSAELAIGKDIAIPTFLRITDNEHSLFGFRVEDERVFFKMLLTVSGVGPKSAMNILSLGSIDMIQDAIAREDVKYLTAVQGLGKKTAERLVVELKAKMKKAGMVKANPDDEKLGSVMSDAIEALASMGYSKEEAKDAVEQIDCNGKKAEVVLREALKMLAR